MLVTLDAALATVRKVATTPAEAERLDREAAILAAALHPGVVQLRGVQPQSLEVKAVTGWCLSDTGPLRPGEVAGIGCAIATILADLHDLGVVHGAVESGHVLIRSNGRPVLCSLGRGRLPHSDAGPGPDDDVVALVALLTSLLPPAAEAEAAARDGLAQVRRALRSRRRLGRRRHPTAQQLATRLAAVAGATLPNPSHFVASPPAPRPDSALAAPPPVAACRKRRRVVGPLAFALGVVAVAVAGFASLNRHGLRPLAAPPSSCPKVDLGCGPVDHRGGIVETEIGRLDVGGASDDPVVLGRWTCGPALPALLRPGRGEVWVWDRWPSGHPAIEGRLVGRVDGATTLRVLAGSSGCDRLAVVGPAGATTLAVNTS